MAYDLSFTVRLTYGYFNRVHVSDANLILGMLNQVITNNLSASVWRAGRSNRERFINYAITHGEDCAATGSIAKVYTGPTPGCNMLREGSRYDILPDSVSFTLRGYPALDRVSKGYQRSLQSDKGRATRTVPEHAARPCSV